MGGNLPWGVDGQRFVALLQVDRVEKPELVEWEDVPEASDKRRVRATGVATGP
jgi:hypothetical protein